MRLKGINIFEQHVEKGVAGLFAVALLGVLTWQFIAKPSTVKVGNVDKPMNEAFDEVARVARAQDAKLRLSEPAGMPTAEDAKKVVEKYAGFGDILVRPVAPSDKIAALDKPASLGIKGVEGMGAASEAIAELSIPAPTGAIAATFLSTVAASEQQNPDVAKILPEKQPYDKAAVTVEAVFDGAKLKAAMAVDPDGDKGPIRAIPKNWYDGGIQILAVELHRQTLKPDGSWTPDEKVGAMPGRTLLLDQLDKYNDALTLKDASKYATDQAEMVRRTPYYSASFGEKWLPPGEREVAGIDEANKAGAIKGKKGQVTAIDAQLKKLEAQLANVGQAPANQPGGGHGGGGGGGGGATGGGGHGGGGGGAAPPPPSGPNLADERTRKQLQLTIAKVKEQRAKLAKELRDLGAPLEGDVDATMPDPNAKTTKTEAPILDNPAVKLWAHDVFVERGKTYRYQMVLVLTNPYFGHSAAMLPDQAAKLAKSGVMRSAPSEWTDPITVDPNTYLFFTSAAEDEPAAGRVGSARAEVYQFKWGFWRRGTKELQPGDSVVAEIKIPDFTALMAAPPTDQNQPGNQGNPGAPGGPRPGPGGGGKGGSLGGPGNQAPATPQGKPDAPVVPAGTQIPMLTVEPPAQGIVLGVSLGQVRDSAGKAKSAAQVFVQEEGGGILVVTPEEQRLDPAFGRVSRSADRGAKEMTPQADNPKAPGAVLPSGPQGPAPKQGGRGG